MATVDHDVQPQALEELPSEVPHQLTQTQTCSGQGHGTHDVVGPADVQRKQVGATDLFRQTPVSGGGWEADVL